MSEQIVVDSGADLIAFGPPLGEKLFVFGGTLACFFFFFFDFGGFRLELDLRGLHFLVPRVGVDHQLENLVFVGGNFFLGELDLVQKCLVLIVGLDVERLVAIFGNFAAQIGDGGFVLPAGGFVGLDRSLSFFQLRLGACQFLLDHGNPLGKFGDFVLQTADFLVCILQFQQILYVGKH